MHLLITGGTGFIGEALCKKPNNLQEKPANITVLSRKSAKDAQQICGANTQIINSLANFDQPANAIINLAGEPIANKRWSQQQKHKIQQSRFQTTAELLAYIKRCDHKPDCFISGSAVGYYGDQGDAVITEDSDFHPEFSHELCAQWEALANQASDLGVRVCLLRTGLVVGLEGGFLTRMLLPFKLGLGGRIGDGRQWMSWVHLDDIVNMILFLIDHHELCGVFNGTAPEPVSNQTFTKTLGKVLNRPTVLPVPAFVLKLALGEMSQLLLTGQQVLPQNFVQAGFKFKYPNLEQALRAAL